MKPTSETPSKPPIREFQLLRTSLVDKGEESILYYDMLSVMQFVGYSIVDLEGSMSSQYCHHALSHVNDCH